MTPTRSLATLAAAVLGCSAAWAEGYTGDLGLGVYSHQGTYKGESAQTTVLPYVYGQWGGFFGRVDTFGYQVLPMGHGFLEVSTRVTQDEMKSDSLKAAGVRERKNSSLFGLSTFQLTPIGAVSMTLMKDVGDSKGLVFEAGWLGRIKAADWLTIYPEIGVEYLSSKYVQYYFGTNAGEGGYAAYAPQGATNPYAAIHTSTPLAQNWNLSFTLRNKALSTKISDSPIVSKSERWNAYLAVSYEFK